MVGRVAGFGGVGMVLHVDVNVTIFVGVGASDLRSRLCRMASRHVTNHNHCTHCSEQSFTPE
jgi:hypothetical protein